MKNVFYLSTGEANGAQKAAAAKAPGAEDDKRVDHLSKNTQSAQRTTTEIYERTLVAAHAKCKQNTKR